MKITLVICLLCFLIVLVVQTSAARKLDRLTEATQQLTETVQRLVTKIEQEQLFMADIEKVEGDPALDHGVTIPWNSGTQTISLTVYKATATETSSELRQRIVDATDKWMQVYPPNT